MATGTLVGTYTYPDGSPRSGTVYILPTPKVVRDETGEAILFGTVHAHLDETGSFSVNLAATDDPALDPVGVTYSVTLRGLEPVTGVAIPSGMTVDIKDLVSVDPEAPTYAVNGVSSVAGLTGAVDAAELADAIDGFISGGGGGGLSDGTEHVNVVAATGSTETLPVPSAATVHDLTLTADCAVTLPSGFDNTVAASIFVLLRQPSSGGSYTKAASWVGTIHWLDGGTPPVVATGQAAVTGVTFLTRDGGATWLGSATVVDPGNQGVTLTYGATVNTDAGAGDVFDLTLTGNAVMAAPSGLSKNKKILYRITQDGTGGRTVTWNAIFRFSTDVPTPFLSTTGGKSDYVGFIYNAADSKLDCIAVARGY